MSTATAPSPTFPALAFRPKGIPSTWDGKPIRHWWTYNAPDGSVFGHMARFDGPDADKVCIPFFRQDGDRWAAGAPPEPRPLFGLDTLARMATSTVCFVVEGEKCASAMQSLGFPTVTAQGGARAASYADWTPLGDFGRVPIIPDNDGPGEQYAADVARALGCLPTPPDVLVARLPGLPEGGDVVNWLQARLPDWDGYAPIPADRRDELAEELLTVIQEHAEPAPVDNAPVVGVADDEWDTPVPLDAAAIPSWPDGIFPAPIQDFVNALAESTETPPELASMMVLATLATAAQGRYRVRVNTDYFEPCCLWTCCALPSGSRKTAVYQACTAPLTAWEKERRIEMEPGIARAESERKSAEARIKALRDKAARADETEKYERLQREIADLESALPTVPKLPQLWTNDVTPERLAVLMAEQRGRMAVLADEGGIFDIMAGRYSNNIPNLDVFNDGHAGSPIRVNRVGRDSIFILDPCLTVGIAPQPDVVRSLADKPGFRGRGLLARFLYALPESNLGRRTLATTPMPDGVRNVYHETIRAMLDHPWAEDAEGRRVAHILCLRDAAFAVWHDFALEVEAGMAEGGTYASIRDWVGKLPGAVARMAGVLHVAEHAHGEPWTLHITNETMDRAIALSRVLCQHALVAFDCMGADAALDGARVILSWIGRAGKRSFRHQEAHAALKHRFPRSDDLREPLDVLVERAWIRQRPIPTSRPPGRPSPAYDVNPACLTATSA